MHFQNITRKAKIEILAHNSQLFSEKQKSKIYSYYIFLRNYEKPKQRLHPNLHHHCQDAVPQCFPRTLIQNDALHKCFRPHRQSHICPASVLPSSPSTREILCFSVSALMFLYNFESLKSPIS